MFRAAPLVAIIVIAYNVIALVTGPALNAAAISATLPSEAAWTHRRRPVDPRRHLLAVPRNRQSQPIAAGGRAAACDRGSSDRACSAHRDGTAGQCAAQRPGPPCGCEATTRDPARGTGDASRRTLAGGCKVPRTFSWRCRWAQARRRRPHPGLSYRHGAGGARHLRQCDQRPRRTRGHRRGARSARRR
jgi:hypothetical protein